MLWHAAPLLIPRRGTDTMGMAAPIYWTAEMVRQLPDDGNRYEVVYGELLVTPAPRLYQEARVPLYWVVDGTDQRVEVWTPDAEFPVVERERLVWRPAGAGQPFTLELAELFRPV